MITAPLKSLGYHSIRLALCLVGLSAGHALAASDEPIVQNEIAYRVVDGVTLKLDVARPANVDGPAPLVVCLHGGGWHKGNRAGWRPQALAFARSGYVSATVDYRLAPAARWPAQIEDVKAAVRFLRAHATKYGIDPTRVAAIGDSAGGHLSLMLALTEDQDFKVGDHLDQPSSVRAVINYYGGADLRTWQLDQQGLEALAVGFDGKNLDQLIESFVGTADRSDPRMASASPATYADAGDPPIITFHGTADILVPIAEAYRFDAALKAAGTPHDLVVLPGANHGWRGEQLEMTTRRTLEFLQEKLRQ